MDINYTSDGQAPFRCLESTGLMITQTHWSLYKITADSYNVAQVFATQVGSLNSFRKNKMNCKMGLLTRLVNISVISVTGC